MVDESGPKSARPKEKQSDSERGPALPSVVLPKGGGAIRGIGEKFAVDGATGTGALSLPIATSPARGGFGPQLSLSYDSGAGNGPFGVGWTMGLPAITRKTDKGLPRYRDDVESDVYVLSGAEDLVPLRAADGTRFEDRTSHPGYAVHRYRPRIEGLFSRIERWTHASSGDIHWRSITRDNITTIYGRDASSRVADPSDVRRVFRWLICESRDDKGNAIVYEYLAENDDGVELRQVAELNRTRAAQRYLKRIRYGNRVSHLVKRDLESSDFLFEVLFDYDEGHFEQLPLEEGRPAAEQHRFALCSSTAAHAWTARPDPFSSYRSGFEVRVHRRCRRVLMFHHVPDLPSGERGYRGLVKATEFDYADLALNDAPSVAEELAHHGSTRFSSFVRRIVQSGFARDESRPVVARGAVQYATYLQKSLPPLEFEYSKATIDDAVREVDADSLENVPAGILDPSAHWVDLHGEGAAGILRESGNAWYYKRNLGPLSETSATPLFGPLELVPERPSLPLGAGAQFVDVVGDGVPDVVVMDGPNAGVFEHDEGESWLPFRPFRQRLNRSLQDPNLRFVDLDGDGRADVLITEDDALVWHASLGADGFAAAERVLTPLDEGLGPRLLFGDGTESIYVADMSGDGLSDLVRVRNGEVCYWPNLGYGRFGAKVIMDNAPWFDHPDQFDQRRVRLTDIDGSGPTDVVYLAQDGAKLYFNQSGNRLSDARSVPQLPLASGASHVTALDLLGNGTACLVWSSSLPGDGRRSIRYVDLVGGRKPHLLVRFVNNLGAEAEISYAPSTRFYLEDKRAGRPWVTRLPFPVHVVERVVNHDRISGNRFATRYRYHHGHFDGIEREFRGFGMVEQLDTEEFAALTANGITATGTNLDASSHSPPVLTRTWFHTGAFFGRDRISNYFAGLLNADDRGEYYREPGLDDAAARALLLEDTVLPDGLSAEAQREACRALKGSLLRQEVYALDGTEKEPHPYTVTEQNFTLRVLQAPAGDGPGVFFAHSRESLSYHYDRRPADPRVGHALTLEADDFGNVLQSATIAYGRRQPDPSLSSSEQAEQARLHVVHTENRVTHAIDGANEYRTPLLAEVETCELTGLALPAGRSRFSFGEVSNGALAALRIEPESEPTGGRLEKRSIEHVHNYYRRNDLSGPLPLGEMQSLGLPFEVRKRAFSPGLATDLLGGRATPAMFAECGYVTGDGEPGYWVRSARSFYSPDAADSPVQELAYAVEHFFLPCRHRDAFHTDPSADSVVTYDAYDLLVEETCDALGNRITAGERDPDPTRPLRVRGLDYWALQPALVMDVNRNRSAVAFDALGMVVGTAVMGKPEDDPVPGDRLTPAFIRDLTDQQVQDLFADPSMGAAAALLGDATARVVYDLRAYERAPDAAAPVVAAAFARETHASDPASGLPPRIKVSFTYSDGLGREIQKKGLAEPGPVPERNADGRIVVGPDGMPVMATTPATRRWVGSSWTVFDNKGRPVRQYEPFFTDTHRFEFDVRIGVSVIAFHDPLGRVVASLNPDHSWQKVVRDPWREESWDSNDTVLIADPKVDADVGAFFQRLPDAEYLPTWHVLRTDPAHDAAFAVLYPGTSDRRAQQRAASKAAVHAGTPKVAHADSLGRTFLSVVHNRFRYSDAEADPPSEEFRRHLSRFDVEGNPLESVDALGRVVMRYAYDMLGRPVRQASMEQGEKWMLTDVAGQPLYLWDSRGQRIHTTYDALRRPLETVLVDATGSRVVSRAVYGESQANPEARNLRGKQVELFDQAGVLASEEFDFKGNLVRSRRRLARSYGVTLDWSAAVDLDEGFVSRTRYDALSRPNQIVTPHAEGAGDLNVIQPTLNEAGRLERVDVWLEAAILPEGLLQPATADLHAVTSVEYDARGQRERVEYGNGVRTTYTYDPRTRRLARVVTRRAAASFPDDCPDPSPGGWPGCQVQNLHYASDPIGNITEVRDEAQQTIFFRNQRVDPITEYTYDATYRLIEATGREHLGQVGGAPIPHSYGDARRTGLFGTPLTGRFAPTDGQAMGRYLERYVYDGASNLLEMQHRALDLSHAGWTRMFEYEEANQLDATQYSNRLSRTIIGELIETYSASGDGYDAHGNPLRMPHLQAMQWDYKDQLQMSSRQAIGPDDEDGAAHQGERTFYVYDSNGQRVRKVTELAGGQLKDERIYLGGFEIYRRHGAEPLVRETLHVMDDGSRVALVETRTQGTEAGVPRRLIRYQHSNQVGSVSLELDDAADIVSYEEYTPFGNTSYQAVRGQVGAKRYRFAGKERDDESGLVYHGARYYAPWLARFCNTDPAAASDGPNLYLYAHANPIVRLDPGGLEDLTIYHRTTEAGAASMTGSGVRTDVSGSHVWAGQGFYGSSTQNIPSDVGASGDTIVAQQVSTDKMKTITDEGFIQMQQNTPEGKDLRGEVRKQMRDKAKTDRATRGRKPSDADVDKYMRDYMSTQMDKLAPGADVVRWQNPDGTYTYVVRNKSALRGKASVAGHVSGGQFHAAEPHTPATQHPPSEPQTKTPHEPHGAGTPHGTPHGSTHTPNAHTPHKKGGRGGGTVGKLLTLGIGVYVLVRTGDAYAAVQTANPAANTTDAVLSGDTSAGSLAVSVATDLYEYTPIATVQWGMELMGPNSPLDPSGGERMYDQRLADQALRDGRNPFCAQCHGPGGALDPNNDWNRRAREPSFSLPSFAQTPADDAALRRFIQAQ